MTPRSLSDINLIVVHTLATPYLQDNIGVEQVRKWHTDPKPKGRGWDDIGYNYLIRRSGVIERGRPLEFIPAHAGGYNKRSIGIALAGGIRHEIQGEPGHEETVSIPVDNYAEIQKMSLKNLVNALSGTFNHIEYICGHRDLSRDLDGDGVIEQWEWSKDCPCFDVWGWYISHHNAVHPAKILKPFTSAHG